ncbi:MAG: DEAD/DEAH box helicase [Planctomycetaceae bacterium]
MSDTLFDPFRLIDPQQAAQPQSLGQRFVEPQFLEQLSESSSSKLIDHEPTPPRPHIMSAVSKVGSASDHETSTIETLSPTLNVSSPDIHITGMNGALKRFPKLDVDAVPLLGRAGFVPRWKPYWPKPKTFTLTFPAGMEFLPPKEETASEKRELRHLAPPQVNTDGQEIRKKPTRIKPPADALSLEDRLFYVLQPPLESWLRGQELIMPFEPFPYQYQGIAWLFSQKAALLADEMGLGKTMQTITAVRLLLRSGQVRRILMICPKPLIPNWQREFKTWAEEVPITTIEGDGARRKMIWQLPGSFVLLANYELVVRDFQEMIHEGLKQSGEKSVGQTLSHDGLGRSLRAGTKQSALGSALAGLPKFDLVVLDEAQRIKNRESITSSVIRSIPRKRSLCLTGTPIENRPEEMSSLFEFMGVVPPAGNPDLRQLRKLSEEFVLRRTKDLVMTDLPPRLDRDEIIELAPAQQIAYDQAEKDGVMNLNDLGEQISIQNVFELVLRLKQIANYDPLTGESAKLERLQADMEEIAASGGKAILFSQWTKTIDWIAARLPVGNPLIYHGGIPTKKREPILDQFKHDPKANILLMSYGTGAVGLNLQFAGYVFLFDRWWNPAVEDQAINRAHRIGATASQIIVSKFICKDTIEERIDKVLQQKRDIFNSVLGDGDNDNDVSLSLTANEIFGLFDLKARTRKGDVKSISPKKPEAA